MIRNFISEKIDEITSNPSSIGYRIIAGITVSLIFSSYPIFIFLIYMWKNGFYSYDVIGEGFSLSIFFYANLLLLVIASLFMLGSITTTAISWKDHKRSHPDSKDALRYAINTNGVFITINIVIVALIIFSAFYVEEREIYYFIAVVSPTIIFLITSLAIGTAKFYFKAVIIVAGIMYMLPLTNPEKASILLADGLRFFGVGNRYVSLHSTDSGSPLDITGELVFLSPNYVYLKEENDDSLIIIPRRDSLNIKYINKKNDSSEQAQPKK